MPLMPGSPRPESTADDGVYRSLFQQPQLEIPAATPSYAWFEFLLHPDALQRHLQTLRLQNEHGTHGATSAMELVRDFLDQAQLVADEGNGRNNRYRALLKLAAQVALQMEMSLTSIEDKLAPHFQRLLLDGVVDFAQSDDGQSDAGQLVSPAQAQLLHNRWTLRTLVRESQNGYLTSTAKNDAEEQMSGFQVALSELAERHLQIAQSLQHSLTEDDGREIVATQTQFEAYYDLAVYFFSFNSYEKAYECFSRALEVLEDHTESLHGVPAQHRASLEGYLAACEAVLELQSIADTKSSAAGPQSAIDEMFAAREWDRVVEQLDADVVADPMARCAPGYRTSIELQALQLVRSRTFGSTGSNSEEARACRLMYKRVAVGNALDHVLHSTSSSRVLEAGGSCARLFHEEAQISQESGSLLPELVEYTLGLCVFIADRVPKQQPQVSNFVVQLTNHIPIVRAGDRFARQLKRFGITCDPRAATIDQCVATEAHLRAGSKRQRHHFRVANDLAGVYSSVGVNELRHAILEASDSDSLPSDRAGTRNMVFFLMLHNCWDVLQHWRCVLSPSPDREFASSLLDFAISCGQLMEQVTASIQATSSAASSPSFSITRCNKIMQDLLASRRKVLAVLGLGEDNDVIAVGRDQEITAVLVELPLWVLEAIVSVCAGLLHRSSMRSLSDHRVTFDLTPYGDLALLVAFAQDAPKKKSEDTAAPDPALHLATASFLRSALPEIVTLHARGVQCLVLRCPREPRWQSASAELILHPIVRPKQPSLSDPRTALCGFLSAASLATNYFSDDVPITDIIDQSSLVRLSQCLIRVGAHVAAAVPYQCFTTDEFKYGQRILQIAPESHNPAFFQYFWELPFLELLVHLHSNPKHFNTKHVTLLTHLIQSPELNSSNPVAIHKLVEHRILRCYFRDLCRLFL